MSKNKQTNKPGIAAADALICTAKAAAKELKWTKPDGFKKSDESRYVSACQVNGVTMEGLIFRASFVPARQKIVGEATINIDFSFRAMLQFENCRIWALDRDGQNHKNAKNFTINGEPQTLSKTVVRGPAHLHIWTDQGYGYAEPVKTPNDAQVLLEYVKTSINLTIHGAYVAPDAGHQPSLF